MDKKIVIEAMRVIKGKKNRLEKDFKNQIKFAICVYSRFMCDTENLDMQKIWRKTKKITNNMCDRLTLYEKILEKKYTTETNKKKNRVIFYNGSKKMYTINI